MAQFKALKTTRKASEKRQIRQPEKWVGKSVLHLDYYNWKWHSETYSVCEWTGKLFRLEDEGYYMDYFNSYEEACEAGYDECCYYSQEGLAQMAARAAKTAA